MRRIYKELLIGFLVLLLFNFIIYFFIIYPKIYAPYEVLLEDVNANNLIFADSHGWRLTKYRDNNTKLFRQNNFENLSFYSDSYADMYFKLNYLINQGISIDTIYLSADFHLLDQRKIKSNNKNRSIQYTDYNTFNEFYKVSRIEYFVRKYIRRYFSMYDVNNSKIIRDYLFSYWSENEEEIEWSLKTSKERRNLSKNRFKNLYEQGVHKTNIKHLQKIFQLCRSNAIQIIGVQYPVAPTFAQLDIPQTFDVANRIWDSVGYKRLVFTNFKKNLFFDHDHVNERGSKIIVDSILQFHKQNARSTRYNGYNNSL